MGEMSLKIRLAHDFLCPWCWISVSQVRTLTQEFDIEVEWEGFELFPEALEWPEDAGPAPVENPDKPKTPSRLGLAYAAENMEAPKAVRPKHMRTHNALQAVEYAKTEGDPFPFIERLYSAYWEKGLEINQPEVLKLLAQGLIHDVEAMLGAVANRQFADRIVGFDDDAYAAGVYNVPTFFIAGERYAEQPTRTLRTAIRNAITPTHV